MHNSTRFISILILIVAGSGPVSGQTNATFTYQGSLSENGNVATGTFNLDFKLWDALSHGNQIGSEIMFNGHPVFDGLFTVALDFGTLAFDDSARWLEITVNGTKLSPRQPITRTPYAIQTRGLHVDGGGSLSVGTTEEPAAVTALGGVFSVGPAGGRFYTLNPNNQNASFSMGWLNDVARFRVGGNGAGASGGYDFQRSGDASLFRILHNGNVGIGTTTPNADLQIVGDGAQTSLRITNGGGGAQANTGLIIGDVSGAGRAASFYGVTSSETMRVQNDGTGKAAKFVGDVSFAGGAIQVLGAGVNTATPVFVHIATLDNSTSCDATGCYCYATQIDHPLCNGDPSAILIVTVNGAAGQSNPVLQRVEYNTAEARWYIRCVFNQHFCDGQKFNVLVIKP